MGRPWRPFASRPIRLFGTHKTNPSPSASLKPYGRRRVGFGNCLDTVKGCRGDCGWCYVREAMARYHIITTVPVSQILVPDLLVRDLRRLEEGWVRVGVFGEPSHDWDLTVRTARVVVGEGKSLVIVTRLLDLPSEETLSSLEELGVVISWTLGPFDSFSWREKVWDRVKDYPFLVLRPVTFAFKGGNGLSLPEGPPVLEQPGRLFKTSPIWEALDVSRYRHASPYLGTRGRWWTAGPILGGPACEGHCPSCSWACGLKLVKR
ncbi:MAG: radical SAM protein [Candidatus Hadarchaeales archaeon]